MDFQIFMGERLMQRKGQKKRNFVLKSLMAGIFAIVIFLFAWLFISTKTFLLIDYDKSQILSETTNQKGESVSFYLRRKALTSDSVLGVYQKGDKTKKIIFLYPTSNVSSKWLDEETLAFSWCDYREAKTYHKSINIHCETYDWREQD